MILKYKIKETDTYRIIKEVLKSYFQISDRLLLKLKRNEKIFLNSEKSYVYSSVKANDIVEVFLDFDEDNSNIVPTKMNLDILYEDECYLIINKVPRIPVHPSMDHFTDSLSNGIRYYFDSIGIKKKIRPVNRLDKDTSGIVIFAKNEYVQECLIKQMQANTFHKEYIAICEGHFNENSGIIDVPIARKENSIIERCVNFNCGENAITEYEVLQESKNIFSPYSVVKCILRTGRTHQIRVHMQYINHPLLGDTLYGKQSNLINRQALHSYKTSFIHPLLRKEVEYIAPIPDDLLQLINEKR